MIGDVLVGSILCNNLKRAFPDAQIHYMVYESTIPVLQGNPNIDKLVLFTETYRKNKWAFFKFMISIRKEKYDILIDSYSKLESWLTVFLSGAKQRISYKKKGRSFLYTQNIVLLDQARTNLGLTIERKLSLLDPLQLKIDIDPVPKLYVTEQEMKYARDLLEKHQVDSSKKTIMVSIIGSAANKTYPFDYMSKILDDIANYFKVNILFNYYPDQIEDAKKIYNQCKKYTKALIYFDVLGGSLREYIALMNTCDLIIGNDGGAINMAKALQKPSFIIFSPWIEKQIWATFEDGKIHKSIHLLDYKPDLFLGKTEKELKNESLDLYKYFKPELFFQELRSFLKFNLMIDNNEIRSK